MTNKDYDVIIIGAGPGGIFSAYELINKHSDLKIAVFEAGNELATNAIEVFSYRVAKYIGSYVAAMNGVDAIAFTAGIGENVNLVREKVMSYLGYLGVTVDQAVNDATHGDEAIISTADSKVKVCVIPTNEELAIARETVALVK